MNIERRPRRRATILAVLALAALTRAQPRRVAALARHELPRRSLVQGHLPTTGIELYATQGTAAGTQNRHGLRARFRGLDPDRLTVLGSQLLFVGSTAATGRELYRSDGTAKGTRLLRDVRPGVMGSAPSEFHVPGAGRHALFLAEDGTSGAELWRSDGTRAGTIRVVDLAQPTLSLPLTVSAKGALSNGIQLVLGR